MTVLSPSLPPLNCWITTTLFPAGTIAPPSKALKNFGTKKEAVASDPTCINCLRLISINAPRSPVGKFRFNVVDNIVTVEVCDATGANSNTNVGYKILQL
jgi:hypothetical protein